MPWQESVSLPRFRRMLAPIQGHIPKPTASSGKGPDRFPWPFQSNCKGLRCSEHRQVYCRTKSSSGPSQRALCCARRGCWVNRQTGCSGTACTPASGVHAIPQISESRLGREICTHRAHCKCNILEFIENHLHKIFCRAACYIPVSLFHSVEMISTPGFPAGCSAMIPPR